MNSINLIGRITHQPELRYANNGTAVTTLRLAVPDRRSQQTDTLFIDAVVWAAVAEAAVAHLDKGRQVAVSGRLRQRNWETEAGTRTAYEIHVDDLQFLGKPGGV